MKDAIEIANNKNLEMQALEIMRNPTYGICYETAEAFLVIKKALLDLNKENEELKKAPDEFRSLSEGKRLVHMLKNRVMALEKEIADAPLIYSGEPEAIWIKTPLKGSKPNRKARLVRIEKI